MRASTSVAARCFGGAFGMRGDFRPPVRGGRWNSGQRRLGQPQNVVRLRGGSRKTIILRPEAGDLELQSLHPGTQSGDLVEQAPIGRRTYVAVEGLRHGDSLRSTASSCVEILVAERPANAHTASTADRLMGTHEHRLVHLRKSS